MYLEYDFHNKIKNKINVHFRGDMLIIVKVFPTVRIVKNCGRIAYSLNQYLICGKPKGGVSNVFVTYFDYCFGGGQYKFGG